MIWKEDSSRACKHVGLVEVWPSGLARGTAPGALFPPSTYTHCPNDPCAWIVVVCVFFKTPFLSDHAEEAHAKSNAHHHEAHKGQEGPCSPEASAECLHVLQPRLA